MKIRNNKTDKNLPLCEQRLINGRDYIEHAYRAWCYSESQEDFDEYNLLKDMQMDAELREADIAASFINLTPHDITLLNDEGVVERIIPSSGVARLKAITVQEPPVLGIPISKTVYSEPVGLPPHETGVYFIVSQLIKNALPHRADLLVPAEVVRDSEGNILGCKSLGR